MHHNEMQMWKYANSMCEIKSSSRIGIGVGMATMKWWIHASVCTTQTSLKYPFTPIVFYFCTNDYVHIDHVKYDSLSRKSFLFQSYIMLAWLIVYLCKNLYEIWKMTPSPSYKMALPLPTFRKYISGILNGKAFDNVWDIHKRKCLIRLAGYEECAFSLRWIHFEEF